MSVELSFCVVNTHQRDLLKRCLDSIAAERNQLPFPSEVLVLDNASDDGSADLARRHPTTTAVVALERRRGKAENDSALLRLAKGRYCLLLNEDSELKPGATLALFQALEKDKTAAAAGAQLLDPNGNKQPCAWRFPGATTAMLGALFLHKKLIVQSGGNQIRNVDWAQSAALMVRREAAAEIHYLDSSFFVYGDEVDFCKRLSDAGWHTLFVPNSQVTHHEQLSFGSVPKRRIAEFSRNRDLYMRKHHSALSATVVRWLTAWTYMLRTFAATILPGHDHRRYWAHVTSTLYPDQREGLREAAATYNRSRESVI